jgi:hypothetical protein
MATRPALSRAGHASTSEAEKTLTCNVVYVCIPPIRGTAQVSRLVRSRDVRGGVEAPAGPAMQHPSR